MNNKLPYQSKKRAELIEEHEATMQQMNTQLEMKNLGLKLNPHFLFNSLNAIQFFVNEGNKRDTLQYIQRFSRFLRNVISSTDSVEIRVTEEAKMLEQYLWLEQQRFPDRFNYDIKTGNDCEQVNIAPLITIGMAEHILYRSLLNNQLNKVLYISIFFYTEENQLMVNISDNGIKLPEENKCSESMSRRMALMNYRFPSSVILYYHSENNVNSSILQIEQN